MRNKHFKSIWLQPGCGDGRTWCQNKITDDDIEYVRADLAVTEGVTIPLPLAQALADGADSLPVWELRGLLERVAPVSPQREKP